LHVVASGLAQEVEYLPSELAGVREQECVAGIAAEQKFAFESRRTIA
jgi:hypothetical protein